MTLAPLVPGAVNFRDVGGLAAGSGRTRSGVLYRSGNLSALDAAGLQALTGLGIRRIVDLRDDREVDRWPSRVGGLGERITRVPILEGSARSYFTQDIGLAELYRVMVDQAADAVVATVAAIARDQPVVVHCTAGKDRTGVTVAMALAAVGVDDDAVVADYARTETLLPVEHNRAVLALLQAQYPDAVHAEELATRSPAAVMVGLLAHVRGAHGSIAGYLVANGLDSADLDRLRLALVED